MRGRMQRLLLWLALVVYVLIAFSVGVNNEVERATSSTIEGVKQAAHASVRKVLPAGVSRRIRIGAMQVEIVVRRHLPVYGGFGSWFARKAASVLIFGLAGLLGTLVLTKPANRLFAPPFAAAVLIAAALSALVEWAQAPEELADVLIDLACGVLGGFAAAVVLWRFSERRVAARRKQAA